MADYPADTVLLLPPIVTSRFTEPPIGAGRRWPMSGRRLVPMDCYGGHGSFASHLCDGSRLTVHSGIAGACPGLMGAIAFGAFIAGKPGGEASGHSPLEASRFDGSSYFRRGLVGTFDALRP